MEIGRKTADFLGTFESKIHNNQVKIVLLKKSDTWGLLHDRLGEDCINGKKCGPKKNNFLALEH